MNLIYQDHGVETFLIRREEPLLSRRRLYHKQSRARLWSEDEKKNLSATKVLYKSDELM